MPQKIRQSQNEILESAIYQVKSIIQETEKAVSSENYIVKKKKNCYEEWEVTVKATINGNSFTCEYVNPNSKKAEQSCCREIFSDYKRIMSSNQDNAKPQSD
eukprot:Pgem_evm1s2981